MTARESAYWGQSGKLLLGEPDSNPNNPTYNVFSFGYSGNLGLEYMSVFSDMTDFDIAGTPGIGFFTGCADGGVFNVDCPTLLNGQTQSGIPLTELFPPPGTYKDVGTMAVTFNDRGDIASTPLPAALPLFATGLGAMGLFG